MRTKLIATTVLIALAALGAGVVLEKNVRALVPGNNLLASTNYLGAGAGNSKSPINADQRFATAQLSANGRFVAFWSSANDLVPGDTNGKPDLFVRDLKANNTTRASVSTAGVQSNAAMPVFAQLRKSSAISSTGRYIAFISTATNLIDGTTIPSHLANQVYVKDLKTNFIKIVSQSASGTLGWSHTGRYSPTFVNSISDDGRFVLWGGGRNQAADPGANVAGFGHTYLTDLETMTHKNISSPTGYSGEVAADHTHTVDATMSCDGAIVAFTSYLQFDSADTNGVRDLFVVDVRNGYSTKRLTNVAPGSYTSKTAISCNGQFISFASNDTSLSSLLSPSSTLMHSFLYDRINDTRELVTTSASGAVGNGNSGSFAAVDNNGNVAFLSASTNLIDGSTTPMNMLFLRNYDTKLVERLSRDAAGVSIVNIFPPTMSSDGRYVAWPGPDPTGSSSFDQMVISETGL